MENNIWIDGKYTRVKSSAGGFLSLAYFESKAVLDQRDVLIVCGRGEPMFKYSEIIEFCLMQGFNVFIYDHIGQGYSSCVLKDRRLGFIWRFDNYVSDLNNVVSHINRRYTQKELCIISHSMGSAVTLSYLAKYAPKSIRAVVCLAPMLNLPMSPLIKLFLKIIYPISCIHIFARMLSITVPGRSVNRIVHFFDNPYTHSESRFNIFRAEITEFSRLNTPGISLQWATQAYHCTLKLKEACAKVMVPTILIAAGRDRVVDNKSLPLYSKILNKNNIMSPADPVVIEGAFHELHVESDFFRDKLMLELELFLMRRLDMDKASQTEDPSKSEEDARCQDTEENPDQPDSHQRKKRSFKDIQPFKFYYETKKFLKRLQNMS